MSTIVYEGFEQGFGEEYPAALNSAGIRCPLNYETRFIRHYHIPEPRLPRQGSEREISRFVDGSASVTMRQLETEWITWTDQDRMDFCQSIDVLRLLEQPDLPAMVRFIVEHGTPDELSCVASSVARVFSSSEAFKLLAVALRNSRVGRTNNIIQAMALTNAPEAETAIRQHLSFVWAAPSLWADADFVNWTAYDAVTCIEYLIRLGASPADFEDFVRKLSGHACNRIRETCRSIFAKHYSWLNEREDNGHA